MHTKQYIRYCNIYLHKYFQQEYMYTYIHIHVCIYSRTSFLANNYLGNKDLNS